MLGQSHTRVKQSCAENLSLLPGVRNVCHRRFDQYGPDVGNLAYRILLSRVSGLLAQGNQIGVRKFRYTTSAGTCRMRRPGIALTAARSGEPMRVLLLEHRRLFAEIESARGRGRESADQRAAGAPHRHEINSLFIDHVLLAKRRYSMRSRLGFPLRGACVPRCAEVLVHAPIPVSIVKRRG
jgi:hypothetical protein